MSADSCFILCAGVPAHPDEFAEPRQLLPIAGRPLLDQTVEQALAIWESVLVVSDDIRLARKACGFLKVPKPCGTCDTILATCACWSGQRIVFLLGDVMYSPMCMKSIASVGLPIAFYGDTLETFAITFDRSKQEAIAVSCLDVLNKAHGNVAAGGKAALWQSLCAKKQGPIKIWVRDKTQDFDTMADYDAFLRGQSKNHFQRR